MTEKRKYKGAHITMEVWKSIEQFGVIVREVLNNIPEHEFKNRSQIENAYNSIGSNFVEGYYCGYIKEYIRFLTYSRRSSAELYERIKQSHQKNNISDELFDKFEDRSQKTSYLIDRTIKGLRNYKK